MTPPGRPKGESFERQREGRPINAARRTLLLAALAAPAVLRAQAVQEIELRHRTAEDLLPLLQPFVEPGGALSGRGSRLFVRASEANVQQLRALLAKLDVAPRLLEITLRRELDHAAAQRTEGVVVLDTRDAAAGVSIGAHGARIEGTRRVEQRIRVLVGRRALIHIGVAIPFTFNHWVATPQGLTEVQATTFYEAVTGFAARPSLAGEVVTLELEPLDVALGPRGIEGLRLMTRVQGRLGEWIALGGADLAAPARHAAGDASAGGRRGLWARVEDVTGR